MIADLREEIAAAIREWLPSEDYVLTRSFTDLLTDAVLPVVTAALAVKQVEADAAWVERNERILQLADELETMTDRLAACNRDLVHTAGRLAQVKAELAAAKATIARITSLCDEWGARASEATSEPVVSWRRVARDLRAALTPQAPTAGGAS
jgi:antirestriction protein ArdC